MADRLRFSAHHPSRAKQHQAAIRKDTCSRRPSLAAIHMPSVGRSSDSRALAKQAFSSAEAGNGSKQKASRFLGYSGGAVPDSHRVPCSSAAKSQATDHQRTLTDGNLTLPVGLVKRSLKERRKSRCNPHLRSSS